MVFSSRKIYADNLSRLASDFKITCELVLDQYQEPFDESGQRSLLLGIYYVDYYDTLNLLYGLYFYLYHN